MPVHGYFTFRKEKKYSNVCCMNKIRIASEDFFNYLLRRVCLVLFGECERGKNWPSCKFIYC